MAAPDPTAPNTDLLLQSSSGDPRALADIVPVIYEELHRLAHRQLQREAEGLTLNTTALVHEAYVKLIDQTRVQWTGRAHFMAVAATAMRRILIDRARQYRSQKRGGTWQRVTLDSINVPAVDQAELLLALNDALDKLKQLDERQAQLVECRFFGGMTEEEAAAALGISVRTARREWVKARAWLYQEIEPGNFSRPS